MTKWSSLGLLKTWEEIEKLAIPGLVEVLREEGLDAVRHVLWDATGWHRDYSPPASWGNQATEEQKRIGWEMAVRIEKILCTVLQAAHEGQAEELAESFMETEYLTSRGNGGRINLCEHRY